jgi:glycosyltransferase involved in cell wall biosynthesis
MAKVGRQSILYIEATKGGVMGGSLTGLYFLVRGLNKEKYRPIVVLYEPKPIVKQLEEAGAKVIILPNAKVRQPLPLARSEVMIRLRRKANPLDKAARLTRLLYEPVGIALPNALHLRRIIRRERVTLIHQNNGIRSSLDVCMAAETSGIKYVCYEKGFSRLSPLDKRVAGRLGAILCVSEAVRNHFIRQGVSPEKLSVVYDGIDPEYFHPGISSDRIMENLGISRSASPLIAIIGNIQEWKGQKTVAEAVARLRTEYPQIQCLMVGGVHRAGQDYHADLHHFIRKQGLENHFTFTGPRTDVADILSAIDVLIHASVRPDPLPRVVLEGMLMGKPIIGSAVGGVPEMISDGVTGRLVPPADPGALAEAIGFLVRDREKAREMGRKAAERVRERFHTKLHVERIEAIYQPLLS